MATPAGPPSLLTPTTNYQDYFARAKTDTLRRRYAAILVPYAIEPAGAINADSPANVV